MTLSEGEREALQRLQANRRQVAPHMELIAQDKPYRNIGILNEGWAIRYKMLPDGKRQILDFLLPGDSVGLAALVFQNADHSVATMTLANVSFITPETMTALFREHPRLGAALYWNLSQEEALVAEHLVNVGRRDAYTRLGHLFLELFWRLDAVGLIQDCGYDFPFNQTILADALGLSVVHVNRILQRLRGDGLVQLAGQRVTVLNLDALEAVVHFETTYLHLIGMPIWLRKRLARGSMTI